MWVIIFVLLFAVNAYSAEIVVDTSAWTQRQKNYRRVCAASLIDKDGYTLNYQENPIKVDGDKIIVDETKIVSRTNLAEFDLTRILGGTKIIDEYTAIQEQDRIAAEQQEAEYQSKRNAIKTKLSMTDKQFLEFIKVIEQELNR